VKKGILFLVIFLLLGLAVSGVGVFAGYQQLQPVSPGKIEAVTFVIPKGQSVTAIGQRLTDAGLIRHPLAFRFVTWRSNLSNKLQAGSFKISPSMSTAQIADKLTQGSNDVWITVLEGWRVEEIAEMIERQEFSEFDQAEFLALAKPEEGYLFPDTYLIQKSATAKTFFQLFRNTFAEKVEEDLAAEIDASGRSLEDIVTIASIVEREASDPDQMRTVAGILWNRIKLGMGLNVDATLQYIRGYDTAQQAWWTPPLIADKESTSPFNTYKYMGLPPHPIANPSLEALKASMNPRASNYLYYIHDTKGQIHFAETLPEHNANVQQYLR